MPALGQRVGESEETGVAGGCAGTSGNQERRDKRNGYAEKYLTHMEQRYKNFEFLYIFVA